MAVLISDIELADIETQLKSLGDDVSIDASSDPVRAAESICRGVALRQELIDRMPDCHSLARNPLGYEDCAECLACFDKLTCIVALHRVGRARPPIRFSGGAFDAMDAHVSGARVTVTEQVSEEVRLSMMDAGDLKEMANDMGLAVVSRHKKSEIVQTIIEAKTPPKREPPKPEVQDKKTWAKSKGKFTAGDLLETPKRAYKGEFLEVCEDEDGVYFRSPSLPGEPMFRTLRNAANAVVDHYEDAKGVERPKYVNGNKFWRIKK